MSTRWVFPSINHSNFWNFRELVVQKQNENGADNRGVIGVTRAEKRAKGAEAGNRVDHRLIDFKFESDGNPRGLVQVEFRNQIGFKAYEIYRRKIDEISIALLNVSVQVLCRRQPTGSLLE